MNLSISSARWYRFDNSANDHLKASIILRWTILRMPKLGQWVFLSKWSPNVKRLQASWGLFHSSLSPSSSRARPKKSFFQFKPFVFFFFFFFQKQIFVLEMNRPPPGTNAIPNLAVTQIPYKYGYFDALFLPLN